MRPRFIAVSTVWLMSVALAQRPATATHPAESNESGSLSSDSDLKKMFEAKIQVEWEALKNKDKKAYAELLADDYQGVEVDGRGERNKVQAVNELSEQNVFSYTLWGLKVVPLQPDAALVVYEVTMRFPPKAQVRYSRVYISEVWVKGAGRWKEVHYQETRVK